jgi:predicted nucleic acid-binding Zn ribbon protein
VRCEICRSSVDDGSRLCIQCEFVVTFAVRDRRPKRRKLIRAAWIFVIALAITLTIWLLFGIAA